MIGDNVKEQRRNSYLGIKNNSEPLNVKEILSSRAAVTCLYNIHYT